MSLSFCRSIQGAILTTMLVSRNFSGGSLFLAHDQVGFRSHGLSCCVPLLVRKIEEVFSASCTIRECKVCYENIDAFKSCF